MKKFKFRLQKVLDVKEINLKQRQRDLASQIEETLQARQVLENIRQTATGFAYQLEKLSNLRAADLELQYAYFHQLLQEVQHQKNVVNELQRKETEARMRLIETRREQKMLANLKMNAEKKFLESQWKEEQNNLDELAILGAFEK